jgi:hypothetical protein
MTDIEGGTGWGVPARVVRFGVAVLETSELFMAHLRGWKATIHLGCYNPFLRASVVKSPLS